MALKKDVGYKNTGAIASYWVLTAVTITTKTRQAVAVVSGYSSQEAAHDGMDPMIEVSVPMSGLNLSMEFLPALQEGVYTALKSGVNVDGLPLSHELHGAEDA